jgi:membrane fusion protein, heavy metal efflux system
MNPLLSSNLDSSDTQIQRATHPVAPPTLLSRVLSFASFSAALLASTALLAWLLFAKGPPDPGRSDRMPADEIVKIVGPGLLSIPSDSSLGKKLSSVVVTQKSVAEPILMLTGRVAASVRPQAPEDAGAEKKPKDGSDHWQFDSPELLTAFTDWQRAVSDIAFCRAQMKSIADLAQSRLEAQKGVVERLVTLVKAGTDSLKDLDAEKANLLLFEIQGRKDVHEAETAVRLAERTESMLARQLQQAGLEPELLGSRSKPVVLVMADVPEEVARRVVLGQSCRAKILGQDQPAFEGKVGRISPTLSKERRSLRVLIALDDPKSRLHPGMLTEVGIGVDSRNAMLVPRDAVMSVGRSSYVLVADEGNKWRTCEVQVGESPDAKHIEILSGVKPGDRVLAAGVDVAKSQATLAILSQSPSLSETMSLVRRSGGS